MTFVIIGILLLAWVAFLAPTLLKAKNNQVRADSVGDFRHRLHALAGSGGHRRHGLQSLHGSSSEPILGPVYGGSASMSPAQRRRRDVLLALAGVAALALIGAVVTRSTPVIVVQLLADAALVGYVYLLIQHKQRAQAVRGARPLPGRPSAPVPAPSPTYGLADLDVRTRATTEPRLVPLRTSASS